MGSRPTRIGASFALAIALAIIPMLEVSAGISLLVVVGSFVVATRAVVRDWTNLPRSLRLTHVGVGVIIAGTLIRTVEAVAASGQLAVPSWADLVAIPGFMAVTASVVGAARAQAAMSRVNDWVDALTLSAMVMTVVGAVGGPYLLDSSIPLAERSVNGGVLALDFVFLTMMLVLVYGPGGRSSAAVWLALAGTVAMVFDLSLFLAISTDAWWRDQPVRILPIAVVAYAVAATDPTYRGFASPGTRPQHYRWEMYPVALLGSGAMAFISGSLLVLGSFGIVTVLVLVRLVAGGRTQQRLTSIIDVQAGLSERLSRADSTDEAIEAAHNACVQLVDGQPVTIYLDSADAEVEAAHVINSALSRIAIDAGDKLPSYLIVALTQVANVLDSAVTSISDRGIRLQLEAEAQAERVWQEMTQGSHEVVLRTAEGRITKASPNAVRDLGFNPTGRLVGQMLSLCHANVDTGNSFADPYRDDRWIKVTSVTQADQSVIFTIRDVTAEHRAARTDPVTGLPNQSDYLRLGDLSEVTVTALSFADLDRAADGPDNTDPLFRSIVEHVRSLFRKNEDRIWRGEGPTLIIVSPMSSTTLEWIEERRAELTDAISHLTPTRSVVTAGVVIVDDSLHAQGALQRAQRATKHGKIHDANSTTHYSDELQDKIDRTWRIENRLLSALKDSDPAVHGLRVEYQPILDANTKIANTLEALVRWTHPELGPIFPDEFIPLAEELELVDRIDRFVLGVALNDLQTLRFVHPDFKVHVNVSPRGLNSANLAALTEQLRTAALSRHIVIEITEANLGSQNLDELTKACEAIAAQGVSLSIDDFGDGESNFARIGELPVNEVKLAKHFAEQADPVMIETVVQSLHNLNNSVVAENVETAEQAKKLVDGGVDDLQGYLYSRPKPFDEVLEWLIGQSNRPPLADGNALGTSCEGADGYLHQECPGWWWAGSDSTTCSCDCHARTDSWPAWNASTVNLDS